MIKRDFYLNQLIAKIGKKDTYLIKIAAFNDIVN